MLPNLFQAIAIATGETLYTGESYEAAIQTARVSGRYCVVLLDGAFDSYIGEEA